MQDIFGTKSNYYNNHNALAFSSRKIKTVRYGLQTIVSVAILILLRYKSALNWRVFFAFFFFFFDLSVYKKFIIES